MNFTPELIAIQGVMISADNVNSFSKLTARGGNEEQIEEVVQCIRNFLVKEKYANDNSVLEDAIKTVRKFAFYIVLNADLLILETMVENEGIDFLIWTIPTVPKCLMCEIMWKLHMDLFVGEVIAFCCPKLGLEVAESFTNHMKYLCPMDSVNKVKLISGALYKLICRLNFFDIDENTLNSALNCFQKCLKYFITPPNAGKLESLRRNQLYKYIGESLYKLLFLLNECIEEFSGIHKYHLGDDIGIYTLTYDEENVVNNSNFKTRDCKKSVLDCLHKCHEELLDVSKELVMAVSVDIFCTWSESELNGKSMQQTIGEFCYKLREKLMNVETMVDHPVVEMLQQISCKPIEVEDVINTTNTTDISENIKNSEDKSLWVRALLSKNNLFQDLVLIENLTSNLNLLQENDFHKLYYMCIEHLNKLTENKEAVKLLAIKSFQHCGLSTKHKILEDSFTENYFSDQMETTDFNNMMIEIFNKLIATPDADLSDILCVFIQSPKKVYKKIFCLATENAQQCSIMGRIMKYLEKYSNYYYYQDTESCIIKTMHYIIGSELVSEAKQNNFINFVAFMKNNNIIPGAKLLLLVIMPTLHDALVNRKLNSIYIQLKMLDEVYTLEELLEYRAPMLMMIAQVLDVVRWKIDTFDSLAPCCLELSVKLQTLIMDTYQNNIPENESSWLKSKLKKTNPLNMYYYRMLWKPPGDTYFEILTGIHVHEGIDINDFTFYVSQVLCSTVLNEWYQLWDSFSIFESTTTLDIFHDALLLISATEKNNRTDKTWACLLYGYRNFINILRYKYILEPITDHQVPIVINKIANIVNLLEEGQIEEFQSVVLPLLAYIAERRNDYTVNVLTCVRDKIKNELFAGLINKLFTNDTV
ncbi:unnamed protein product [Parnassius mnemosyne]|uniref:Uncharacterized protein n=1 Tax=Parnassius mnemosyne TaxID=213953 RepID=A0AAV1M0I0_9NEOP